MSKTLREALLSYADECDCEELRGHVVAEELRAIAALADQAQEEPVAMPAAPRAWLEGTEMNRTLRERVMDEADLCRNEGADDIARLLDEVAAALADQAQAEPVAYKVWHPGGSGYHLSSEPPEPTRQDSGEPNEYFGGTVEPLYTAPQPAAQPVAVPDSYALVPVEPTPEMCKAAVVCTNGTAVYKNVAAEALKIEEEIYGEVYAAMLSAAPKVQQ